MDNLHTITANTDVANQYATDHLVGRRIVALTITLGQLTLVLDDDTIHTIFNEEDPDAGATTFAFEGQPPFDMFIERKRISFMQVPIDQVPDRYFTTTDAHSGMQAYWRSYARQCAYDSLLLSGALPDETDLVDWRPYADDF